MGIVLTGTVCPFPFTFGPGATNSSSVEDCTETYAQALAPKGFFILQYTIMAFSLFFLLIFAYRFWRLAHYAHKILHKSVFQTTQYRFFVSGFLGSALLLAESIDLFAFDHVLPKEVYFVSDELLTVVLYVMAVHLVDFWAILALSMRSHKGLPLQEKRVFYLISALNFPVFIVVGMLDYTRYFLYEGIKSTIGALLLILFVIRGYIFIRKIEATLLNSGMSRAGGAKTTSDNTKNAIHTFQRKFLMFSVVLILGALGQLLNAFEAWGFLNDPGVPVDLAWEYPIADQIDPTQILLKVVYLIAFFAILHFFNVPKSEVVSHPNSSISSRQNELTKVRGTTLRVVGAPNVASRVGTEFKSGNNDSRIRDSSLGALPSGLGFKGLMQDQGRREKFANFVTQRYASESLKFYESAMEFAQISNQDERVAKGNAIIQTHFAAGAPHPVTVQDQTRKTLLAETEFGPDTFKAAFDEISEVIYSNFYNPFITFEESSLELQYQQ